MTVWLREVTRDTVSAVCKLDAGDAATFARINCPAQGVVFSRVVDALHQVR